MRSSQTICFECRRRLVAAALHRAAVVPRLPQWQARAPCRSTSSTAQTPQSYPVDDQIPPLDPLELDIDIDEPWATEDGAPSLPAGEPTAGQHLSGRFSTMSWKRKPRKMVTGPSRKNSLKIFENVIRQQVAQERRAAAAAAAASRDLSPENVEYYTKLAKLRPMMKEQKIEDCLEFFLTELWNKTPFEERNRLLKQRGAYLMTKVAEAKAADFDNGKLPSVAQITQYFHDMDSLGAERWSTMMMSLIRAILAKSSVRTEYESDEAYATASAKKEELIDDLVDSWIMFHRHKMSANDASLQTSDEAEFRLPDINQEHLRYFAFKENYKGALGCIFPEWMIKVKEIPAVAIATFVLLVDHDHSTVRARQKAQPLLVPIGHVVSACPFGQSAIAEMLEPHPTILLYVLKQWDTIIKRLHGMRGNDEKQEHKREASITKGNLSRTGVLDERDILARIRYALGMSDVLTLEAVWRHFWGPDRSRMDPDRTKKHAKVFNHFIMTFTALKKPNRAIDTWDAMISIGLSPTLETWSCLIEGCRKSRNAAGIEKVWRKLEASGLLLDETVWSSRIMGLMEAGEPEAGLRALSEMLKKSRLPDGVPLNIKAVNAAVTGLLRLNAMSAANKVLNWASQHGIEPDVFTYNILLGPMVQQGQVAKIESTIQLMSDSNVKPNAATYTILLESLIGTTHDLTPAQQRLSVKNLFADMEKDGVVAYHETFARMLHLVLRDGDQIDSHTEGPVGAIFEHMDSKGLRPSPHMLTMLVDHYFARNPPALKNIEQLLQRTAYKDGLVDRVFWERVIKGYALAGATDRAFAWFEKTYNISANITLNTMEILLRALVEDNHMSAAARVVDDVKQHRGASIGTMNNSVKLGRQDPRWDRYWRHGFWAFAMDCGLLGAADWRKMVEAGRVTQEDGVSDAIAAGP